MVFGLGATGLAVARALGRRGYSVAGVDPRWWEIGHRSRFVNGLRTDVAGFAATLAGDPPHPSERSVVFACGDPEVMAVTRFARQLEPWCFLPRSYRDGAAAGLIDKRILAARVRELGVLAPETVWVADPQELREVAARIPAPWVVKPALAGASEARPFAGKARLVAAQNELGAWPDVILQAHVPGPISSVFAWVGHLSDAGVLGPTATIRKRRERPSPFGSASWAETVRDDEVDTASRRLTAGLGLTGTVSVEWKRHDGRLWLIEVNPRSVLWMALAEAVVVDAFQALRGAPRPPAKPVPVGLTWRYAARDPLAPRADLDALWTLDDPAPGLLSAAYTGILGWKRLVGGRF